MPVPSPRRPLPGRLIGFYALSVMDREGPLYGYQLSERIADRTDGSWRPGAGAIYPALQALTQRKLARVVSAGRRRVYRITPAGRTLLRRVRSRMAWRSSGGPDLSRVWSEIAGTEDPGRFMMGRVQRDLAGLLNYLSRPGAVGSRTAALRRQLESELHLAGQRLRQLGERGSDRVRRTARTSR
jgi:DNA-binding PadR family transcriptional regulator